MVDWNYRIVRIWSDRPGENSKYLGSAFFISPTQLLTATHVIYGHEWNTLRLKDGQALLGGVRRLAREPDYHRDEEDVAILTIGLEGDKIEKLSTNECDNPKREEKVNLLGFESETSDLYASEQTIASCNGDRVVIITDKYIASGMSGAPVIRANKLVGITHARTKEKNQTHIIPYSSFKDFIKKHLVNENKVDNERYYGDEDLKWYSALIDKNVQTDYAYKLLSKEEKQSAFIVFGEGKDWPDAVADRLAWELCLENLSKPKALLWGTKISRLNKDASDLLRCLVYEMLTENKDFKDITLTDVRNMLKIHEQAIVFTLRILPHACDIDPKIISDFIHYWDTEMMKGIPVKHVLLISVTFGKESTKRSSWFKVFSKNKVKCKDRVERELKKEKLIDRILPEIKCLNEDHVSHWKDDCLNEHLKKRLEQQENTLFQKSNEVPHRELKDKIVKILAPRSHN